VGCREEVPLPTGGGETNRKRGANRKFFWGQCPSPENFSIADLKMVSFDAFCVVF